jgi:hypothetical protein
MPTDFAPYANVRILWTPPGTITNFRSGTPAAGTPIVIEAFLKGQTGPAQDLPSIGAAPRTLQGYITAYATLPAQTSWLAAGSAFSWNTTGLAPDGLLPGITGRGFLGDLTALPSITGGQQGKATVISIAGSFGIGGIGAELRAALGDAITISLEVPA